MLNGKDTGRLRQSRKPCRPEFRRNIRDLHGLLSGRNGPTHDIALSSLKPDRRVITPELSGNRTWKGNVMGSCSMTGSHRIRGAGDFFREHGYTEKPRLVQWFATLKCGMDCPHCLAATESSGFDDMSIGDVFRLLEQVSDMGVEEFLVTGGEPLARADLPEVLQRIGELGIVWSLNTATTPSPAQRKALEKHPPAFVAVSVDGPREVHDSFRGKRGAFEEARDAISYFSSLGSFVCAGTTVTSFNFPHLEETFGVVLSCGADRWGIHLPVPEGRASARRDLFLSRKQLRRLIGFVARKRKYFDVEMADEIGYLGHLEPLVRERPLICGAGRSQCVVLPDGSVMPCTTLDRRFSAGNCLESALADIWRNGFQELRNWQPEGRCLECRYSPACRGGCWLQRKSGRHCYRDVWSTPDALISRVGAAVCLGLASLLPPAAIASDPPADQAEPPSARVQVTGSFEEAITSIYTAILTRTDIPVIEVPETQDPGWLFIDRFAREEMPAGIRERCLLVREALETESRSLSLVALMWRVLSEEMLDGGLELQDLQGQGRSLYIETMELLRQASVEWRPEFVRSSLLPFVERGGLFEVPFSMLSKAGPRPGQMEEHTLTRDLALERLEGLLGPDSTSIQMEYLHLHPFAGNMILRIQRGNTGNLFLQRSLAGTRESNLENDEVLNVGVFDRVSPGRDDAGINLTITCCLAGRDHSAMADDPVAEGDGAGELRFELSATLQGGREYTYAELLHEIHEQNAALLDGLALDWIAGSAVTDEGGKICGIVENEVLLWPSIRILADGSGELTAAGMGRVETGFLARLRDCDMWMF